MRPVMETHPDRPPRRHGDVMPKFFRGAAAQAIPSLASEAQISIVTQDLDAGHGSIVGNVSRPLSRLHLAGGDLADHAL